MFAVLALVLASVWAPVPALAPAPALAAALALVRVLGMAALALLVLFLRVFVCCCEIVCVALVFRCAHVAWWVVRVCQRSVHA